MHFLFNLLDIFFVSFHCTLIVFNLFGWIWKKTRKANLLTLGLTGASWFILGIFYGIGYCPLTDWHWKVLYELGETNIPYSYIKYLIDRLFHIDINAQLVDYCTGGFFFLAVVCSVYVNIKPKFLRKNK